MGLFHSLLQDCGCLCYKNNEYVPLVRHRQRSESMGSCFGDEDCETEDPSSIDIIHDYHSFKDAGNDYEDRVII